MPTRIEEFAGRHVVVTGAGGGLGRAVVLELLERGAICHLPSRGGLEVERFSPATGRVHVGLGVDVTDEAAVASFYGKLPGLWASIHCAGGFEAAALADTSAASFSSLWSTNALSAFLCSREAVRAMRRTRPAGAGGRIVNVVARAALEPALGAGMGAYTASKAAVAALTVALAEELAAEGIRVNAVAPSIIDTPANRRAMPGADPSRWVSVEDIAQSIAFLASPSQSATRGALIPLYAGS